MTYAQSEESRYGGKPVEIYTFKRDLLVWRYTSSESDKTVDGFLYPAAPIQRGELVQTTETIRNALDIKMAATIPFVQSYLAGAPSLTTFVEVRRYHYDIDEFFTWFSGRVINLDPKDGTECTVNCESYQTSILKPVLTRNYQVQCPHVLYQTGRGKCNADKSAFAMGATLAGVSSITITASGFASHPDGYFNAGWVDWSEGTELQRRFIRAHEGANIEIDRPFIGMQGGATVTVYPGCDHNLLGDCLNKFDNTINNGGFPYMPSQNPFTTQVM